MAATHPLQPLTREELLGALEILRSAGHLSSASILISALMLKEPTKQFVFSWHDNTDEKARQEFPREALATLFDRDRNVCSKAVICLRSKSVTSFADIPGVQASIAMIEFEECVQTLKDSKEFHQKLVEHYGTENPIATLENITIEPWSAGYYGNQAGDPPEDEGKRLMRPLCWFKDPNSGNPYAYPVEGIRPVLDLNRKQVVRIDDHGKWPLPPNNYDHHRAETMGENLRKDLKSLEIVQKEGPSFQVSGNQINWQKWSFVVGFNSRTGLTLHDVRCEGRPILYHASISEMVVPYGDPSPQHSRKNAFDVGEYGIGLCSIGLKLGCDCLGEISYLDWDFVTGTGEVSTMKNAICIHEEDYGILWKHYDRHTDSSEVRRSRRLVVSHFASVGNYDYGFYWYFYQDGTIQLEIKLTGFLALGTRKHDDPDPKFGTMVAPGVYAPYHQHLFNYRLDFAVDGIQNTVSQIDVISQPNGGSEENPFGNGFYVKKTPYKTELESLSNVSVEQSRTWEIANSEGRRNHVGTPTTFKLVPGDNTVPYATPESFWRQRARFVDHHVWVTPYNDAEFYCAGEFPNQSKKDHGLGVWTQKNRPIEGQDCVLWYSLGVTHIPRLEDYPIMPMAYCGFQLKPSGFFDRNPAFDVPPQCEVNKP